jgi:SNF2 family DNA or RNA helicase
MLDLLAAYMHCEGFNFERIDGQKSLEQRTRSLDRFRIDSMCTIMLASVGSVAEG